MFELLFIRDTVPESEKFQQVLQGLPFPLTIRNTIGSHEAWFYLNSGAYVDAVIAPDTIHDEELVELLCLGRKNNPRMNLILYGFQENAQRMNRLAATCYFSYNEPADSISASLWTMLSQVAMDIREPDASIQRDIHRWDPVVSMLIHFTKHPTIEQNLKVKDILNDFTWQNLGDLHFRWNRYVLQLHKEDGTFSRDELIHIGERLQNRMAAIGLGTTYVLFSHTVYNRDDYTRCLPLLNYAIDFLIARDIRLGFLSAELLAQFSSAASINEEAMQLHHAVAQNNYEEAVKVIKGLQQKFHTGAIVPLEELRRLISSCILMIYNKLGNEYSEEMMNDLSFTCSSIEWPLLFSVLHRWLERIPAPVQLRPNSSRAEIVRRIQQQINGADLSTLSPESIAAALYRSPAYINEVFKQEMSISLVKYISDLRLKRSAELILETNRKIIDISRDVGYSNYTYFCQIFRKRYGVSPAKYRTAAQPADATVQQPLS